MKTSSFFDNIKNYENIVDVRDGENKFVILFSEIDGPHYLESFNNEKAVISDSAMIMDYNKAKEIYTLLLEKGYRNVSIVPSFELYHSGY